MRQRRGRWRLQRDGRQHSRHCLSFKGLRIMLTFEYVVVGIPPSVTEGIPLAPLLS